MQREAQEKAAFRIEQTYMKRYQCKRRKQLRVTYLQPIGNVTILKTIYSTSSQKNWEIYVFKREICQLELYQADLFELQLVIQIQFCFWSKESLQYFQNQHLHNIQLQNSKQQRHYIYASQKSIYVYQYNTTENNMLMTITEQNLNTLPQNTLHSSLKKKYSKVNQSIRDRFLSFIIQHNMSIKEASQTLNINYSSAKAILASHRKKINGPKKDGKQGPHALYRSLNQLQDSFSSFSVICSTGGRQTSRFGDLGKVKGIHKSSISPVIVLKMQKQVQSSDHTINNASN